MTVFSASLPPERYSTTRLRDRAPWARAMSARNDGAVKLTVNAATPPRMKSRREMAITFPLHQLIFGRPDDESGQAGGFDGQLRIRSGPCTAGVQVLEQRVERLVVI